MSINFLLLKDRTIGIVSNTSQSVFYLLILIFIDLFILFIVVDLLPSSSC